jgi:hypothetical protein
MRESGRGSPVAFGTMANGGGDDGSGRLAGRVVLVTGAGTGTAPRSEHASREVDDLNCLGHAGLRSGRSAIGVVYSSVKDRYPSTGKGRRTWRTQL